MGPSDLKLILEMIFHLWRARSVERDLVHLELGSDGHNISF